MIIQQHLRCEVGFSGELIGEVLLTSRQSHRHNIGTLTKLGSWEEGAHVEGEDGDELVGCGGIFTGTTSFLFW